MKTKKHGGLMHYRQGDVLLQKIDKLPNDLKPVRPEGGRFIIARGEVTGHSHAVEEAGVEMFVDANGALYLSVEGETVVRHEEHEAKQLPPGIYTYVPQREYTPEEIRNVAD